MFKVNSTINILKKHFKALWLILNNSQTEKSRHTIKQDLPDFHQIDQSIATSKDYHNMNVTKLIIYMYVNLFVLRMITITNACGLRLRAKDRRILV